MSEYTVIYLQPECCAEPETGRLWCHHVPEECSDGMPWTKYVLESELENRDELLTAVDYNKRDEGLWVKSDDIVVAYLQKALHKLHDIIESEK